MTTDITDAAPFSKQAGAPVTARGRTAGAAKLLTCGGGAEHSDSTPAAGPTKAVTSKLDQLAALLSDPTGASIAALMTSTGWQAHSVRGAMAGALRKRGLTITSQRVDGIRIYRAGAAA